MTRSPTTMDRTAAYNKDPSTRAMLNTVSQRKHTPWSAQLLSTINSEYRTPLTNGSIQLIHNKLILLKPIFKDVKYVGLIIVPEDLRRVIFSHYHAGPSGGRMGEFKTLFRIRMRFFWPGIRKDIKLLI